MSKASRGAVMAGLPIYPEGRDRRPGDTSRVTGLMELAALRLLRNRLGEGETSIAVETRVTHASIKAGRRLRAVAHEIGANGRLHRFLVHVFDETGLVASAEHTRAVVGDRKLLGQARRQAAAAAFARLQEDSRA